MTAAADMWPQEKLDRLWALQRLARREGNRVVVVAGQIYVSKAGETRSFDTVDAAEGWHEGAP